MKTKPERIIALVIEDIAEFFPYLFIFYVVCFLLSLFFESWKIFFNWETFHISVWLLAAFSLFSAKGRALLAGIKTKGFWQVIKNYLLVLVLFSYKKVRAIIASSKKPDNLAIEIVTAISICFFFNAGNFLDTLVLAAGLLLLWFTRDGKLAAGGAMIWLALSLLFLTFSKEALAEIMANYVYYFFVITIAIKIKEIIILNPRGQK